MTNISVLFLCVLCMLIFLTTKMPCPHFRGGGDFEMLGHSYFFVVCSRFKGMKVDLLQGFTFELLNCPLYFFQCSLMPGGYLCFSVLNIPFIVDMIYNVLNMKQCKQLRRYKYIRI
jgi:hypothetical protein